MTSATAAKKAASLAFDGLLKPLIFLTNWSEAARISSSVTGGSKLKRVLMFLHIIGFWALFCNLNPIAVGIEEGALIISVARLARPVKDPETVLAEPFRHAIDGASRSE